MSIENGFDPKDLEDICSRKRTKFKMKKADYKELGRNLLLGSVDVAIGSLMAAALVVSVIPTRNSNYDDDGLLNSNNDGWQNGSQGYGYYENGVKIYD
jgi:hypothetical protein